MWDVYFLCQDEHTHCFINVEVWALEKPDNVPLCVSVSRHAFTALTVCLAVIPITHFPDGITW